MSRFDNQLAAAQRQYESLSPDDDGPDFTEDAIASVAASLVEANEVDELLTELYAAMPELLAALSRIPQPSYDVSALLMRLRSMAKAIESKADELFTEARWPS